MMQKLLRLHTWLYRPIWRGVLLLGSILVAVAVLQSPDKVAANTSEYELWVAPFIMWGVVCGVVNGLGFRFKTQLWSLLFSPLLGFFMVIAGLIVTRSFYLS